MVGGSTVDILRNNVRRKETMVLNELSKFIIFINDVNLIMTFFTINTITVYYY